MISLIREKTAFNIAGAGSVLMQRVPYVERSTKFPADLCHDVVQHSRTFMIGKDGLNDVIM